MISINFSEENKKILIVGGGRQALIKGEKFPNCIYLSPSFIDDVPEERRILKTYEASDVDGYFLVIAATNNKELNHQIVLDANERNILSSSINADEDATVHFQKEMDFPYLHLSFTTRGACPGYHTVLEKDFEALYQKHEVIIEDLQVIRNRSMESITKYATRNEFIASIVEKDPAFLHFLAKAINEGCCRLFTFHSHKTDENIEILNSFISKFDIPSFYSFKEDTQEIVDILKALNVYTDYYPITLRDGKAMNQMKAVLDGECVHPIYFSDKELSKMMRDAHYPIYIYHPRNDDSLKAKLARSYVVCDLNDELPEMKASACACLLLKGGHFQKDIQSLADKYPMIEFDSKCLFEQDFFMNMLMEKIN